jgi:hypothetical protein
LQIYDFLGAQFDQNQAGSVLMQLEVWEGGCPKSVAFNVSRMAYQLKALLLSIIQARSLSVLVVDAQPVPSLLVELGFNLASLSSEVVFLSSSMFEFLG